MEKMVIANIALDLFCITLSLVPIIYLLDSQRYKQWLHQYFFGIVISNIFMIIGDLADWIFLRPAALWQKAVLYVFTVLYYAASAFLLYFFFCYIAAYIQLPDRTKKICLGAVRTMCVADIILALVSPVTGSVFYVTDDGYQRGPLFVISQIVPLACYLLFAALVIIYNKRLKRREVLFFLLYIFLPLGSNMAQIFFRGIAVINSGVSLAILLVMVNIQMEHEVTLKQQEKELAEQRIDIMLGQIQPHFLYNTLDTIAYLCRNDPEKAENATKEFSMFLRGNMDSLKNREPIPFEKELRHVKSYLYLEQQRFQNRLTVVYDIRITDFFVPPLSLQPLVENAVRHGILRKREGGMVTLRTAEAEEYAVVTIMDDGIGMDRAKTYSNLGDHTHIGIDNVHRRIQMMVNGTMEIESNDQGTVITIKIPLIGGL